ncbi:MAG TPA: hypothetical protein VJT72_08545 [Pseudonocardiaceae bacterium]|nr:hypothetical protein [Pseudonocardiaceae bacterium]
MLTLHLVPVGRSLLSQIEQGILPTLRSALAVDELLADTVGEALRQATGGNHELDLKRLGLADVSRSASAADASLAAEWTSVAAVAAKRRYSAVDGEAYVFIATDTDDGLRAATLVAARYQSTIHYLHEPLSVGRPALEPCGVYVCRIPDLDLGFRPPTSTTWRSLGTVGGIAADTAKQTGRGEWEIILHLTGGYKAMIPYLMVLAEGVNSRLRELPPDTQHRPKIRAVALHDPSLGRTPTQPRIVIDIPVRAIGSNLLAEARKLKALARPDSDTVGADVSKDLRGLFIERENARTYRLSEAGLIMVNVL